MVASSIVERLGTFALGLALLAVSTSARSNDTHTVERAILVLDASGSMWGQVEGTPKIAIARDVIDGLLQAWNPNVELGVCA